MRYSSVFVGFALGLMAVAAVGFALALFGMPTNWPALASLFAFAWSGTVVGEWAWDVWGQHQRDIRALRERDMALAERAAKLEAPDAPEPVTDVVTEIERLERRRLQEIAHWQVFYRRIWGAGTAYGWDRATLTDPSRTTYVLSQPGWKIGTDNLAKAGYLRKDTTGTYTTVTSEVWDRERLWEKVPCPAGEPPEIASPPYTKQPTTRETTSKQADPNGDRAGEPGPRAADMVVEG